MWKIGVKAGTAAGIALGLFLWIVEQLSGVKVYTLLLNIDFLPWLGIFFWPEAIEWLFHLMVSWVIGVLFVITGGTGNKLSRTAVFLLTGAAALSYFPLSMLAEKQVPALTDWGALFYWLGGHLVYAIVLYYSAVWLRVQSTGKSQDKIP